MKQEHEDEQEQRSFDSVTLELELELELDPFRSPSACSPQSASQCQGVSRLSVSRLARDALYSWIGLVPGIERTRRAAERCRRQHVKVACLTPTFEVLAGVSRPGNWGQPRLLRVTRETFEGSPRHWGPGLPGLRIAPACLSPSATRSCNLDLPGWVKL